MAKAGNKAEKGNDNPGGQHEQLFNPYPGLRPFKVNESHLFFGREGQTDEVLQKLSNHRFVGIIGPSGSGKSSFVYCGVLPILFGGFLTNTGPNWDVIVLRPGSSPIENLATALLEKDPTHSNEPEEDHEVRQKIITTLLRSNSNGLIEAIKQIKEATNMNYLILVDQFEELFRYRDSAEHKYATDDSHTFINLLMQAVNAEDDAYYVAITMRSDFIGDCAQYAELTGKINDSHYLIPQLTREQKRKAIEGPASVAGGDIATRLVHRLLNDLGDNQDQLPILQHAMMRTWDYWSHNREGEDSVMDLKHYEAIGTMEEALSMHADEAFNELDEEQKRIAEVLFKTITEKRGTFGIRRPTKLKEIAAIAGCSNKELAAVVVTFRQPGRSFLTPPHGVKLNPESVIDISHESLMRIWVRLKNWVDEEAESVNMYIRLAEAGELYQIGKGGLWRPPNLQLALNWQVKNKPTLVWGQRYDPAFERTMSFLEYSKKEYDNEQKVKELQLKRKQRNQRITVGVLASATIISIAFLVYALQQKGVAERQTVVAKAAEAEATIQKDSALYQRNLAIEERDRADEATRQAEENLLLAMANEDSARRNAAEANKQRDLAQRESERANENADLAQNEQKRAEENADRATRNAEAAIAAQKETARRNKESKAQFLGSKASQNIPDPQLRGLLAMRSYLFNNEAKGKPYSPDVSAGLYAALSEFNDPLTVPLAGHAKEVYTIKASPTENKMYSAGTLGRILEWDLDNPDAGSRIIVSARGSASLQEGRTANIKDMDISHDGQWLVAAGIFGTNPTPDETYLEVYNTATGSATKINGVLKEGGAPHFTKDDSEIFFIDDDGRRVNRVSRTGGNLRQVYISNKEIKDMALHPDGDMLAVCGEGMLRFINISDGSVVRDIEIGLSETTGQFLEIEAMDFNAEGTELVYGDSEGTTSLMNPSNYIVTKRITDHKSPITDVDYNVLNGKSTFLSTSSLDNTVRIYHTSNINDPPITYTIPNTHIYATEFTKDNRYIFVGAEQKILKKFPIESSIMADKICDYITREFTDDEWDAYVGLDEFPKENTCNVVTSSHNNE